MSFKKICAAVIAVPIAVILIAFIVANRELVPLNLDIFSALFSEAESGYSVTAPLFIWLFAFLLLGILIGALAFAPKLYRIRRQARRLTAENARLNKKLLAHKTHSGKDYSGDIEL